MSDAPRVLMMTPAIDGADGISEVSRQVVTAVAGAWGRDAVEVWTLRGPRDDDSRVAGVRVRSAAGGRARMSAWVLARSRGSLDGLLVLVMHVHLAPLALLLAMRGARVAVFLYGIEVWTPLRRRETSALDRASALVAISRHTVVRFRQANPRFADRDIAVCHLGVAPSSATPVAPPIDGYALIVGRLASDERYKGHDALIDAWPEVRRRVPGARLVVVGDGDDRPRLEALARDRGVEDCVTFAGRVSAGELAGWYEHAAFFVMPSTGEGFGLTYVEAMRAGKPCIASRGAAEEILETGVTGVFVDPASRGELAGAIVRLFTDRDGRERMGRAAATRVAREFEERHFAARLLELLTPLVAACASGSTPSLR
jgi:phosphatidylinositol alpha-1,6-mannosyltransferase